ncbi:hypothetical protein CSC94_00460 [Zhengella mangrovi]|uniref:Uncharacterized protein n=1 Tax=Zhengella mangrovi TaxID=1982044 RepID=A0A2G1QSJ8_9HYPH|nr:hypothetical protein [Zhengella mangrovi]PHP68517.1 hypothetical protein CSC94_00460 [Zhengella mangrovi]
MTRELDFDETAKLAASSAQALAGYPADLAGMIGEMVLWLERHRLPGLALLADWLEHAPVFDASAAGPVIDDKGMVSFPDPFVGGMFIVDRFDEWTLPGLFEGPKHGSVLMAPFLAMAAHKRSMPLEIVFFGDERFQGEAGRLVYRDGKSAFEGKPGLLPGVRQVGISRPEFLARQPRAPLDAAIAVDEAVLKRLTPAQAS